jgi:hypothetical protein
VRSAPDALVLDVIARCSVERGSALPALAPV